MSRNGGDNEPRLTRLRSPPPRCRPRSTARGSPPSQASRSPAPWPSWSTRALRDHGRVRTVPRWHRRAARLRQDRAFLVMVDPSRRDYDRRDRPRAESLPDHAHSGRRRTAVLRGRRTVRDLAGSYPVIRWRDSGASSGKTSRAWSARSPKARTGKSEPGNYGAIPAIHGYFSPPGRSAGEPPNSHRSADPGRSESSHGHHALSTIQGTPVSGCYGMGARPPT